VKSIAVLLLSSALLIPGRLSAKDDSKHHTFDSKGVSIQYTGEFKKGIKDWLDRQAQH
jgi:hypothetical protein